MFVIQFIRHAVHGGGNVNVQDVLVVEIMLFRSERKCGGDQPGRKNCGNKKGFHRRIHEWVDGCADAPRACDYPIISDGIFRNEDIEGGGCRHGVKRN